jgi:hypothetical protein
MASTSFTRHAWARVLDRLSLSPADVAALLDYDLAVPVGTRGRAVHRLFYSPPDQQCFVAVQDQEDAAVLTVLPLDYHEKCAWPVSESAQKDAEERLRTRPPLESDDAAIDGTSVPSVFRVGCYLRDGQGTLRPVNLGSIPAEPFDHEVHRLLESDVTLDELERRVSNKSRLGEVLVKVFVRLGKRGPVTMIDLRVHPEAVPS